jgi:hypothetical protein
VIYMRSISCSTAPRSTPGRAATSDNSAIRRANAPGHPRVVVQLLTCVPVLPALLALAPAEGPAVDGDRLRTLVRAAAQARRTRLAVAVLRRQQRARFGPGLSE